MTLNRPFYEGRPIGSVAALARALGVEESRLRRTAKRSHRLYRGPIPIAKPGRRPRMVYAAEPALRDLQQRILDRILQRIRFPDYLMGGLKGRSYIGNARRHMGSRVLVGQDVDAFYPSIPEQRVRRIFLDICHFAPEVAEVLARLTTFRRALVQGGVTSTHIGNLALYRTEPELERELRRLGVIYSRFVDDAYASTRRPLSARRRTQVVSAMRASLERHGYRPKRAKQFVATFAEPMQVHGLNVNASPSVPRARRQQLRNSVFLIECWARMSSPWDVTIEQAFARVSAQVAQLRQTNPGEARRLRARLKALMPARSAQCGMPGDACPYGRGSIGWARQDTYAPGIGRGSGSAPARPSRGGFREVVDEAPAWKSRSTGGFRRGIESVPALPVVPAQTMSDKGGLSCDSC